jgi:hypothetical protein
VSDLSAVYKAIAAVSQEVGKLGKGAFNQHGGYKFVSIDKYYETVGLSAAQHGLSWVLSENTFQIRTDVGKSGMIHATYDVAMLHESGACIPNFSKLSILHPIQGAQTVGSAMSYVDKVFMRQLFRIATGEEDADSTNPADMDMLAPTPPPKKVAAPVKAEPAPKVPKVEEIPGEEGDWGTVINVFKTFIPTCTSEAELRAFWTENTKALNALKEGHPVAFEEVKTMFTQRKNEVKG